MFFVSQKSTKIDIHKEPSKYYIIIFIIIIMLDL